MGKKKLIYISAPITGMEDTAQERFSEAESILHKLGYNTINPYERNKGFAKWEDAILAGLRQLKKCDGICLCDDYKYSRGSQIERMFANGMNLETLFLDSLKNHMEDEE